LAAVVLVLEPGDHLTRFDVTAFFYHERNKPARDLRGHCSLPLGHDDPLAFS
jgi:hypothetical protein